jgi:hypothetical protein
MARNPIRKAVDELYKPLLKAVRQATTIKERGLVQKVEDALSDAGISLAERHDPDVARIRAILVQIEEWCDRTPDSTSERLLECVARVEARKRRPGAGPRGS